MDIDNIPFGTDFRTHLHETLDSCDILLVVIGPRWLGLNEDGQPRLFEEADWVRIEIATALAKQIPVIPLLVEGARMPKPRELPEDLNGLAFRQAAVIDVGVDFRVHMERLIKSMDRIPSLSPDEGVGAIEKLIAPDTGVIENLAANSMPSHVVPVQAGHLNVTDDKSRAVTADEKLRGPVQDLKPNLQQAVEEIPDNRPDEVDQADKIEPEIETGSNLRAFFVGLAGLICLSLLLFAYSAWYYKGSTKPGFENPALVFNGLLAGHWCASSIASNGDFYIFSAPQTGELTFTGLGKYSAPVSRQGAVLTVGQSTTYMITTFGTLTGNNSSYVQCPK
jgi:hypothetical protein